jgi:2'-5' RNA ligase
MSRVDACAAIGNGIRIVVMVIAASAATSGANDTTAGLRSKGFQRPFTPHYTSARAKLTERGRPMEECQ